MVSTRFTSTLALGALCLLAVSPAFAQADTLDVSLDPTFGSSTLSAGFEPDPLLIEISAGGLVDASAQALGTGCRGFAATAPDYRINWSGESELLRLFFEPDDAASDTTLIVNTAGGQWTCNDDGSGVNPVVTLENPTPGQIDIWVGTFTDDNGLVSGTLYVTENPAWDSSDDFVLDPQTADESDFEPFFDYGDDEADIDQVLVNSLTTVSPSSLTYLPEYDTVEASADPLYGVVTLGVDQLLRPYKTFITSGGGLDASELNLGTGCNGFITAEPSFRVLWNDADLDETLAFIFTASDDTTLIVQTPEGDYVCNDDAASGLFNPQVNIEDATSGVYDIWVGSFNQDEVIGGRLRVGIPAPAEDQTFVLLNSELEDTDLGDDVNAAGLSLDPNGLTAITVIETGFLPDPQAFTVPVTPEADSSLISGCNGFTSTAPSARVYWLSDGPLNFSAVPVLAATADGGHDATLVVRTPDNQFLCNDDVNQSTSNPVVAISNAQSGVYTVWVGTYAADDEFLATVYVSEAELSGQAFYAAE